MFQPRPLNSMPDDERVCPQITDTSTLWPPNHEMVPIHLQATVQHRRDAAARIELVSVTSSEADDAPGAGTGPARVCRLNYPVADRAAGWQGHAGGRERSGSRHDRHHSRRGSARTLTAPNR